jgi:hydroxypyruvate isomerase
MTDFNRTIARRQFLARSVAAAGAAGLGLAGRGNAADEPGSSAEKFHLQFAPHPGMFRASAGNDVIDQINFAHDQGFTAWEHNSLGGESPEMQERVGQTLADLRMQMGVFVAYASFDEPTFAAGRKEDREMVLSKIRDAVDVAQRCGATWFTVVPGSVDQQSNAAPNWNKYGGARLAPGYQTANVIDLLRRCSEILEPHDLVMVLEPLNWYANHGGVFLQGSDQAYAICEAVNSPSCKILFDIYHQQITEGNLIPNIERCWDQIAYFQAGDNPGRKEPGTGEIHYKNVFRRIHELSEREGRQYVIGMEHGNSRPGQAGEAAVIQAYREVDVK